MTPPTIEDLRRQLREKFPQAHGHAILPDASSEPSGRPFEISSFPAGAISEIVPTGQGGGLSLWIAGLLADPEEAAEFPKFVLVDGGDTFDPASHTSASCSRLLWVRCRRVPELLKAADLLVRDGNVPFIMLDLCGLPVASLKTIPASAWWRLKQLAETNTCRLVVLAPFPLVPCASFRMSLSSRLTLADFDLPRSEILRRLVAQPNRLRHVT
ncbi:MAG: hypothetical protein ABIS50_13005 [Luteolibacter sp.]|uniref:hypothetical protein n=1 Tax=Luteolibacter sp. TaxID=1962973 RepID=UPI0032638292